MMSTFTGLLVGMLLAALLTVMYGQQLSHTVRDAIDKSPAVKALLARPPAADKSGSALTVPDTKVVAVDNFIEAAAGAVPMAVPAPAPTEDVATPARSPQAAGPAELQEPNLEQRWSQYAASADTLLPAGSFPWQRCFQRSAASYDLPLALLLAVASGESNFDPAAVSTKNAIGLMQIRWPTTSRHLGVRRQADLYDPCINVDAGARYLRELTRHYANNLHLAIAAYNYGPSRVTAASVPEGALWYSHYIFQHLQRVLGMEPAATSQLIAAPARPDAGREVLMTFTRAHRARDFITFLSTRVPDLNLQQQSETLGRHEVVLLYGDAQEKARAMRALESAGLEIFGPPSNTHFQL